MSTGLTDATDGSTNKNDTITGSLVDDYIDAGNGNDFVFGNWGKDTLLGGNGLDNVFGGEGNDLIGVANLDAALRNAGSGDNSGDFLYGDGFNSFTNYQAGFLPTAVVTTTDEQRGIGHDRIFGGNGKDTIYGDNGGASTALIGGNDTILAGNGVDTVSGEGGNDVIVGENGHDIVSGGAGNDYFVYNSANESSGTGDTVIDFSGVKDTNADNDKIDLRAFLGDTAHIYNGATNYVAANNDANQLNWGGMTPTVNGVWFAHSGGNTFVYADTNGDGAADLTIKLIGIKDLTNNDFYGVKNAGVTVDPSDTSGSATERTDGAADENTAVHSATGTINFSDPDFGSVHTASATPQDSGYVGTFVLGPVDDVNTDVDWTFAVGDGALDYLAAGQQLIQKYDVTIDDGAGGTATETVTITITGTNDAPEISAADGSGAATEDVAVVAGNLSDTGTITFDDVDLADSHVTGVVKDSGTLGGNLGAIVTDTASGAGDGTVTWTYTVANANVQYLAVGETASESFTVTISDGNGGSDTQSITVTVTGTNDAPEITVGAGDSAAESLAETNAGLSVSDTLTVNDVDVSNTVNSSVFSVVASGTTAGAPSNAALLAMLSVAPATGLTADPGDASNLTWTFNSGSEAFNYLNSGQSLVLTYTVQSTDSLLSDDQTVVITINGSDDAPTDLALSANSVQENALLGVDVGTLTATGGAGPLTYSLLDSSNGRFSITTGGLLEVQRGEILDLEDAASHVVTVQVTDSLGATYSEAFTINLTNMAQSLTVSTGADTVEGSNGADSVLGGNGADRLYGGLGNDTLNGGGDADIVAGQAGDDTLLGDNANDIVLDGGAGNDTLNAGNGADLLLVGGGGNDILTGTGGGGVVETFKWYFGDQGTVGTPAKDTITDYNSTADVLHLADLLQGEHANAASLDAYLDFNFSGSDTTVSIRPTGSGGDMNQQIILQGVNLNASNTLSDSAVITSLLTTGKLIVDI